MFSQYNSAISSTHTDNACSSTFSSAHNITTAVAPSVVPMNESAMVPSVHIHQMKGGATSRAYFSFQTEVQPVALLTFYIKLTFRSTYDTYKSEIAITTIIRWHKRYQ